MLHRPNEIFLYHAVRHIQAAGDSRCVHRVEAAEDECFAAFGGKLVQSEFQLGPQVGEMEQIFLVWPDGGMFVLAEHHNQGRCGRRPASAVDKQVVSDAEQVAEGLAQRVPTGVDEASQ